MAVVSQIPEALRGTTGRRNALQFIADTWSGLPEHFRQYVAYDPDGCWLWTGGKNSVGYGTYKEPRSSQSMVAHRYAYEVLVGPIPQGYHLRRPPEVCTNRHCVRPSHVVAGKPRSALAESQKARDVCLKGHRLDGVNKAGKRTCSTCLSASHERSRRRKGPKIAVPVHRYRVSMAVSTGRARARKLGVPAPLTTTEWRSMVDSTLARCCYCMAEAAGLDHVEPLSLGGSHAIENVVPACVDCNNRKRNKPLLLFLLSQKRRAA